VEGGRVTRRTYGWQVGEILARRWEEMRGIEKEFPPIEKGEKENKARKRSERHIKFRTRKKYPEPGNVIMEI
jgi:hypothetical protein